MKTKNRKCAGLDEWEIGAWIMRLGSFPIAVVESKDYGDIYEIDKQSVLKLENGKYAIVSEIGCSCYTPDNADIELFPDEKSALKSFEDWKKEKRKP